jgi:glycosyltransferase involved in cell wall biosynthesis
MKKITLVIPAYNEEKRIGPTLEAYGSFFSRKDILKKVNANILVVINNTTDKTEEIVKKYSKIYKKISYVDLVQGGKGYAVVEGFKLALKGSSEYIGFVDADMATLPTEYMKLVDSINGFDGAIADRYLPKSIIKPKPSIQRLIAKRMFNFVIRVMMLLPYRDTQCGAKVFKRKAISEVINQLSMSKWAFDVELLYFLRKNRFNVISVPTKWIDKEYSTINFWQAGPWMVLGVLRLRIINSPLKNFMQIYDKLVRDTY